jgi:hypothetical protein
MSFLQFQELEVGVNKETSQGVDGMVQNRFVLTIVWLVAVLQLLTSRLESNRTSNRLSQDVNEEGSVEAARIDLNTANLFHMRLKEVCVTEEFRVFYDGPLGTLTQSPVVRRDYNDRSGVTWSVFEKELHLKHGIGPLFQISVSTKKLPGTVATCSIKGKTLYLRVPYIKGERTADEALPQLGGSSVRVVIDKMTHPRRPAD